MESFTCFSLDRLFARIIAFVPLHEIKLDDEKMHGRTIVPMEEREKFLVAQREMRQGLQITLDFQTRLKEVDHEFKNMQNMYCAIKYEFNKWTEPWRDHCHLYCKQVLPREIEHELKDIEPSARLVSVEDYDPYAILPALSPGKRNQFFARFDNKPHIKLFPEERPHPRLLEQLRNAIPSNHQF